MNFKIIGAVIVAFFFILSCWLFFWPLVECIYAGSWEPILSDMTKGILFCFGGMIFFIGAVTGVKLII